MESDGCLVVPSPQRVDELQVYDKAGQIRLRFLMDATAGYIARAGVDFLAAGLVCQDSGQRVVPRI